MCQDLIQFEALGNGLKSIFSESQRVGNNNICLYYLLTVHWLNVYTNSSNGKCYKIREHN